MNLSSALIAQWGTPGFDEQFKGEVEQLPSSALPLQQGLARTSYVSHEPFRVVVKGSHTDGERLSVTAGIFYSGIIAGCSCADDPTPIEAQPEYCELLFIIERNSGATTVTLLD